MDDEDTRDRGFTIEPIPDAIEIGGEKFDLTRAKVDLKYFTEWAFPPGSIVDEVSDLTSETVRRLLERLETDARLTIMPRVAFLPIVPYPPTFEPIQYLQEDAPPFRLRFMFGWPVLASPKYLALACVEGAPASDLVGRSRLRALPRPRLPRKTKKAIAKWLAGAKLGTRERRRRDRWTRSNPTWPAFSRASARTKTSRPG
jgi:hypothetical protein